MFVNKHKMMVLRSDHRWQHLMINFYKFMVQLSSVFANLGSLCCHLLPLKYTTIDICITNISFENILPKTLFQKYKLCKQSSHKCVYLLASFVQVAIIVHATTVLCYLPNVKNH